MQTKKILLIFLFTVLSLSSLSIIRADVNNYVYAGNGVVVYPTYILRQVCHPFMPCGIERIDITKNNNNKQIQENTGQATYRELSTPGFREAIKDQKSPTYDPLYHEKYYPTIIISTTSDSSNYKPQSEVKHFASNYNTRNAPYSNYNQVQQEINSHYTQSNSNFVVLYM